MSGNIDWTLCVICQKRTSEELQYPIRNPLHIRRPMKQYVPIIDSTVKKEYVYPGDMLIFSFVKGPRHFWKRENIFLNNIFRVHFVVS